MSYSSNDETDTSGYGAEEDVHNFHTSCRNIRLEQAEEGTATLLCADVLENDGEWVDSKLILDDEIGNGDGKVLISAQPSNVTIKVEYIGRFLRNPPTDGFTENAKDIQLEWREDEPWLTAQLQEEDGGYRKDAINLASHIGIDNGDLCWSPYDEPKQEEEDPQVCVFTSSVSLR